MNENVQKCGLRLIQRSLFYHAEIHVELCLMFEYRGRQPHQRSRARQDFSRGGRRGIFQIFRGVRDPNFGLLYGQNKKDWTARGLADLKTTHVDAPVSVRELM